MTGDGDDQLHVAVVNGLRGTAWAWDDEVLRAEVERRLMEARESFIGFGLAAGRAIDTLSHLGEAFGPLAVDVRRRRAAKQRQRRIQARKARRGWN